MSTAGSKVIAIAGPNGAGKTTLAPFLIRDTYGLLEFVNADALALGLSAFNPDSVAFEAGRIMLRRLSTLAAQRVSFAFETTLATRSYTRRLIALRQAGYEFHLIYLWLTSADLAVQRVQERVRLGGHDVAAEVVRRRYVKGRMNFFNLYQPLADTWGVYDNSKINSPLQVAIGRGRTISSIFHAETWAKFCAGEAK
jgi:predicted ABC-type ATPase